MYKGVDLIIIHVHVLNYNSWFPILGCSLMALAKKCFLKHGGIFLIIFESLILLRASLCY